MKHSKKQTQFLFASIAGLISSFIFTLPGLALAETKPEVKTTAQQEIIACESAREFITTFEYLRSDSELGLGGDSALKYATEVAQGCSGAAKRFIQTVRTLRKSDLSLQDVLNTARDLAKKDDITVEAFNSLFKILYAQDSFDLDLKTSLDLAKSLSLDFAGNTHFAMQDFERISKFCLEKNSLDLPHLACAHLAQRVAKIGGKFNQSVHFNFIQSFRYLTKADGPGLSIQEALLLSEDLLQKHPLAFGNFKQAYEYAVSSKGLNADKKSALSFGQKLAGATAQDSKTE